MSAPNYCGCCGGLCTEPPKGEHGACCAELHDEQPQPDLELARLRLSQAEQRLIERYPRAASDPQLASILGGLRDALGPGAEGEPAAPEHEPVVFRKQVTPDMAVVTEAGGAGIDLEVTDGLPGHLLRRVAITNVGEFKGALDAASMTQQAAQQNEGRLAAQRRLEGMAEARRLRGEFDRGEAVDFLVGKGVCRTHAAAAVARAMDWRKPGEAEKIATREGRFAVTHHAYYWRVDPVPDEGTAECRHCGKGIRQNRRGIWGARKRDDPHPWYCDASMDDAKRHEPAES